MAKVRVYELAKELGLDSKELLAKLQEVGEFVKSASSTVEAPVVRKLMEKFPDMKPVEEAPKVAKKAVAKKSAAKKVEPTQEEIDAAIAQLDESTRNHLGISAGATAPTPAVPRPPSVSTTPVVPAAESETPAADSALPKPPRPGNNPFATPAASSGSGAIPRPPRVGNNPFSSAAGGAIPRPPANRPIRPGERPPMSGNRPGAVRPGFAARPPRPGSTSPTTGAPRPGGAAGSSPYRTPSAAPTTAPSTFGGKGGGRHQRGGTAGAFGKQGSKKGKAHKSKKALREEFDNMAAPSLGGAVVPHGDGKTIIRLRRGATLMDFAEKINADPASLVSALFHLGEMVTATQSVDEDTFTILGGELVLLFKLLVLKMKIVNCSKSSISILIKRLPILMSKILLFVRQSSP